MRADGVPSGVAVARVMALASSGSCVQASVIQSSKPGERIGERGGRCRASVRSSLRSGALCRHGSGAPSRDLRALARQRKAVPPPAVHGRSRKGSIMPDRAPVRPAKAQSDAGQARPDHGGDQRPLARLGHRRRLRRAGRGAGVHLPGRGAGAPRAAAGRVGRARIGCSCATSATRPASTPRSPRCASSGTGWISWSMRSASPTSSICAGAIWTRRARRSCRRWTSPATRSSRWRSARCR